MIGHASLPKILVFTESITQLHVAIDDINLHVTDDGYRDDSRSDVTMKICDLSKMSCLAKDEFQKKLKMSETKVDDMFESCVPGFQVGIFASHHCRR